MVNKKGGKNLKQKKIKTTKPQKNTKVGKFKNDKVIKQKKRRVGLPEKQLKKNVGRELSEHKSPKFNKKPKLREKNFKRNQKSELNDQNETASPARGRKRKLKRDANNSQEFQKKNKTEPSGSADSNVESEAETELEKSKKKKRRSRLKKKRTNIEGTDESSKIAPNAGKFLLINLIKTYLKEKAKTIPVSKMQKRVLVKYCQLQGVEESPKLVKEFHRSLKSTFGVEVVGDVVKLLNR